MLWMKGIRGVRVLSVLACVSLATAVCARVDRQLLAGLDRTSAVLVSDVPGKVNLARYRDLVGSYTTELTAARARAQTAGERAALEDYETAYTGLKDMLTIWEAKDAGTELLPLRDPLNERVARQYKLPVNTNEPPSIYASEALPEIWAATKAKLELAAKH